jgi:hypothetical protein
MAGLQTRGVQQVVQQPCHGVRLRVDLSEPSRQQLQVWLWLLQTA